MQTIEVVTEIWLKSEIPMKSSRLHSKQLLKIFEWWKNYTSATITSKEMTEKDFVKVWQHYLILLLKTMSIKFLVIA